MYYSGAVRMPEVASHGGPMAAHNGLVIHVQQGDNSTYDQDNDPTRQVSSTWWCGKSGVLQQMLDTDVTPWTQVEGNSIFNSVECEGFSTEPMTTAQVDKLGELYAWGHLNLDWPLQTCDHDGHGLTTHAHYPSGLVDESWGGHACPGPIRAAQLPAILKAAEANVTPAPTPEPAKPVEGFGPIDTIPANGNLHVAAVDKDGRLIVWYHPPNGEFHPQVVLEGCVLGQQPRFELFGVVPGAKDGALYLNIFARKTGGAVVRVYQAPGEPWKAVELPLST
jgi:hypothetical protein